MWAHAGGLIPATFWPPQFCLWEGHSGGRFVAFPRWCVVIAQTKQTSHNTPRRRKAFVSTSFRATSAGKTSQPPKRMWSVSAGALFQKPKRACFGPNPGQKGPGFGQIVGNRATRSYIANVSADAISESTVRDLFARGSKKVAELLL
jgi:hypothetical protein